MKILMVTPYLPYPLYAGGQIRTFNLLKQLGKKHEITLIAFIRDYSENQYLPLLEKYTSNIITIKRRSAWNLINILLAGFSNYPFLVSIYYSPKLKRILKELFKKNQYDLIHAETFYVLPNIPKTNIPVLLVEQTIEYLVYKRYSQNFFIPFLRPFLYWDVAKITHWEKHYWQTVSQLATVSQEDKNYIIKETNRKDIQVVPNGVDFKAFETIYLNNLNRKRKKNVIFVGNFTWLPNREAVKILVKEIWPKIHKKLPSAKLFIVGRKPRQEIIHLNNPELNVQVLGEVNNIQNIFAHADLTIVPIQNGRGTKYKVLEAIASGIPVIGTPLAVEGLHLTNQKEVFISSDYQTLANYAIQLLSQPQLAKKVSQAALAKLKKDLSWDKVAKKLDNIYLSLKQ